MIEHATQDLMSMTQHANDTIDHPKTTPHHPAYDRLRSAVFARLFDEDEVPETLGRYTLQEAIGSGGMGTVFRAYDQELDRNVAVKLLNGQTIGTAEPEQRRLLREAQAMARLSHPNVVQVYDAGTHDGRLFVTMELIAGQTLRSWGQQEDRSWDQTVDMFRDAGRGLAAAHRAGLVHRDFKPENVIVAEDGRCRVADFGLVRSADETTGQQGIARPTSVEDSELPLSSPLTRVGTILGTPMYMSPEQHLGQVVDTRSDQFSCCVALYEAVYKERPFAGKTLAEWIKQVLAGRVRTPLTKTGPRKLLAILRKGLAVEPKDRYASMELLLEDLAAIRKPRIGSWRLPFVALSFTAMLGGLGVLAYEKTEPQPSPPAPALAPDPPAPPIDYAKAIHQEAEDRVVIDKAALDRLISDPQALAKSARAVPAKKDGVMEGVRLYGVRAGSLPLLVGIQNGDMVTEVAGIPMTSIEAFVGLYPRIRHQAEIELHITRKGQKLVKFIELRAASN